MRRTSLMFLAINNLILVRRSITCQDNTANIICPLGHKIHVISANFGRTSKYFCNGPGNPTKNTQCTSSG